jgi:hypothetical protein
MIQAGHLDYLEESRRFPGFRVLLLGLLDVGLYFQQKSDSAQEAHHAGEAEEARLSSASRLYNKSELPSSWYGL